MIEMVRNDPASPLDGETLIRLAEAGALVKDIPTLTTGHARTLHPWASVGIRGRKLETVWRGGMQFTSKEAVQRFLEHRAEIPTRPL